MRRAPGKACSRGLFGPLVVQVQRGLGAAVHHDGLAGDGAGLVAGQKQRRLGDVPGLDLEGGGLVGVQETLAGLASKPLFSGVFTKPGQMALQRMLLRAKSMATERVMLSAPALAAE